MRIQIDDIDPEWGSTDRQQLVIEDGENSDEIELRIEADFGRNSIKVKRSELKRALIAVGFIDPV